MNSLDEFQVFESMIQKSEETLKRNRTKKPRTTKDDDDENESPSNQDSMQQMEFLKNIISTEFSNYQELSHRDELIKTLCHRLHQALQNNEEIKKSEMAIAQELQDMKHEMQQFSTLVNKCKDPVKTSNHLYNNSTEFFNNKKNHGDSFQNNAYDDESSLELCRKQILSQSSFLSQIDYNHIDMMNDYDECDKSMNIYLKNGIHHHHNLNSTNEGQNVQMLIDQIKTLESKIHSERQSYLEENERLNSLIDEKQKLIDELLMKQQQTKQSSSGTCPSYHQNQNNSSQSGSLYDWRIEDSYDQLYSMCVSSYSCSNNRNEFEVSNNLYNLQTNNRLLVVLSDLVKTFLDTENDIQKQLESLGLERGSSTGGKGSPSKNGDGDLLGTFPSLEQQDQERLLMSTSEITTFDLLCEDEPDFTTPSELLYSSNAMNSTLLGGATNNNNESTALGTSNQNDIEDDVVLGASRRLRFAVERVLKILSDTLEHQKHDFKELLKQKEDLRLEFQEECQRSDKLTRQLMDKENLIKNLENDKKSLMEKLVDYQEIKTQQDCLREKLEEFERERDKFVVDNKRLEMERKSFDKGLPQLHQKLLHENEILNRDIRLLQQDKKNLSTKINNLTSEVESLKTEKDQIIENKNTEFEELLSQLDSKEKNLNSLKRFIEEQTQERELEREEFTKEVSTLKDKFKEKEKYENKLKSQIRSLESQITLLNDDNKQQDEQMEEMEKNLKELNSKLSELNQTKRQLETEIERNNQIEKELRSRLKKLSNVLQVKLNDETSWHEVINAIDQFVVTKSDQQSQLVNRNFGTVTKKLNDKTCSQQQDMNNSIFTTIKMMDDKIQDLNLNIESLMAKNENLKLELKSKNELIERLEQIKPKVETLEQNLKELTKTNELLQQEINASHMKYSELKVKLDSSVDVQEFKKVVNDLQNKLNFEKKQNEIVSLKLEQANRHANELMEKLDAYKKEIKSFKELLKSHDHNQQQSDKVSLIQNKDKGSDRRSSKDFGLEINQLNNKIEVKDRTISLLEQNVEILKFKLESITQERDIYQERLKTVDESRNKITIYEKNLEKLRLQNKISSDKITYLELEIQNLRKKIDLLEKENEMLKVENQKLMRQKQEMNAVMFSDYVDEQAAAADLAIFNGSTTNLIESGPGNYLNGFDKMNHISSNNLLMLKVRRLLTQKGALIYQKNYLIHVLGSYQRTENDTLALLANFNNSKDADDDEVKMKGRSRFRSIIYALIALNRMKFMVNIWKCRKRQLLFHKTANSIASLQNVPLPPRKTTNHQQAILSKDRKNCQQPPSSLLSSSANISPSHPNQHFSHKNHLKHQHLTSQINSTLKDYVDRLHVVHETLGLHTNKRL